MRLVVRISLLVASIIAGNFLTAQISSQQPAPSQALQNPCPGVPGACGYANTTPSVQSNGPQSPQNGNGTLGVIFDMQKCGLNYASASQRLGKRFTPQGINQPAPFTIGGIPACAVIERAYLWAEGSGNGAAQTATIAGPYGTQAFPMTVVGQGPDKCWGYSGSYTYRADVTAIVGGNGTYNISGILTNPPTAGNDMDGATLLVIWSDASQNWAGRIVIADGAIVINGGNTTYNMPINPAVCGATTNARGFFGIGDIQFNPNSWSANGTPCPLTWNWWNFNDVATTVANGATTAPYSVSSGGDCYNLCIAGLYFRTTTCTTCPLAASMTATSSVTAASCSNCNGTATITNVTGGNGPFTYSWNTVPIQTTATATGLCAGTYVCTITSANGCQTATQTVTITNAGGGLTIANNPVTNVSCAGGSDGSITATSSGGTGPFTFTWNPVVVANTFGNTSTANNLAVGTYVVTVTDANGCTGSQTFTLTAPPPLAASLTTTNVLCNGGNSGSAAITGSGGVAPYTFAWSPAATNSTAGNTNTGTGLTAQTYNVTVTDANGCSMVQVVNITEPTAFTANAVSNPSTCNQPNGNVTATTSGGTGAPTYLWTPGNYSTAFVNNLASGTYQVVATDANGCTATASAIVAPSANMTVTQTSTDLLCFQDNSGTASITVTGNTGPLTYVWTPNVSTTNSATGLAAGTYMVDASDPNGCSTSSTITITEPPQLTATVGGFNVSCFGACDGQIVVIPAGGTGNYTFAWSNGCNQPSCNGICAGTYNVTVTDQNMCTVSGGTTVTEPPQIVVTTSYDTAHCGQADGNAYVTMSGGTGQLTATWQNPISVGTTLPNVAGGAYQCIITDANNCADTVTVNVFNQTGVVATMGAPVPVSCFGGNNGSVTATYAGGNGPYTYNWNTIPSQTTPNASGLTAGSYMVTATDADGCTSSANVVITEPPVLTIAATATPSAVCLGQPVTLNGTATGGTAGYTMVWMPGSLNGSTQNIVPTATGCHSVTVTDANGCIDTTSTCVTVNPIPVAGFVGDSLMGCAPLCVNFLDQTTVGAGTITLWDWDFGDNSQSAVQDPMHCYVIAGVYTVSLTVTSNAGCTNTIVMNNYIDVFGIPTALFTASPQPTTILNPIIYFTDQSLGAATWAWSFGDITPSTSNLQNPSFEYPLPGCYDVILDVSSVNGCTDTTMQQVCIDPDVSIYVPNTFTPNEDGINDFFFAQGLGIDPDNFELWVFDRWGNLIFYSDDFNEGWNGKVQGSANYCQEDTYVWKIKCRDLLEKKHSLIGHVNLIR
jgi:gliding motility-associated-like protein